MSQSSVKERFLKNTQWLYIDNDLKTIFSHAGVSSVWLESIKTYLKSTKGPQYANITNTEVLKEINNIEPCELFGFTPDNYFDSYGDSKTQPLTWIRPQSLCKCNIKGYDQVVGHTPVQRGILNMKNAVGGKQNIWLCDAMGINQYLKIEDNEFIVCKFEENEN